MRLLVVSVVMAIEQRDYARKLQEVIEQQLREDDVAAYVKVAVMTTPGNG